MKLQATDVSVRFKGVSAVEAVSFGLSTGEILGMIGPNGAGKTTLIDVLSGFVKPCGGSVALDDTDVTDWTPERRAKFGIVRTFQSVRLFERLTLVENVASGCVGIGLGLRDARTRARELLNTIGLARKEEHFAASLPHGEERLVGIARALAADPSFLLLDEPVAGLTDEESDKLLATLRSISENLGSGLLVVEHNMRVIMSLCDRLHVLDHGRTLATGSPAEVRTNPEVRRAYLGVADGKGIRHPAP